VVRTRYTIQQAATTLGITESAIRKRIKRGQLEHDKEQDGRVYVYLDSSGTGPDNIPDNSYPLIVARLENENEFLRRELERRSEEAAEFRRIIAGLVQRVPELEPAREPRDAPVTPSEDGSGTQKKTPPEEERRSSWWRRMFGG
jgi:hypothetical protein